GPTRPVTVVHVGKNPLGRETNGDALRLKRPTPENYTGIRGGAYVVRTPQDWQKLWREADEAPPFPQTVNPLTEMLIVVASEDALISQLKIARAVETTETISVVVRQRTLGEGCVRKTDESEGVDAVVVPRADKPVKFFVEDEDGASCGEPPKAEVGCRIANAQSWSSKLSAMSGEVVECELSTVAQGAYGVVEQALSLTDSPPGSNAKLAFTKGSTRATFTLDEFGTYTIRAEVTDEAGRKGRATAFVDMIPKKTRDVLVQLTWPDVDTSDLPAPLPRVVLGVGNDGGRGRRCSSEVPVPGLCDAKTRGAYTYMKIPASRRRLPLSLHYLDERAQSGPVPCVNVWFNGDRTVTTCDKDHRHAEDRWEIGTIEAWTGKVLAPKPQAEAKHASASGKPDAHAH
ncbi:MAG TPA: hypothetical protein VM580_14620, partial [Labilithrix sp.]|nr:hypothetical protein [Labilithrix sp.]